MWKLNRRNVSGLNCLLDVTILPEGGLDNGESVRLANSKADRSTIRKHRTDENSEDYAKIYNDDERIQTEVAR